MTKYLSTRGRLMKNRRISRNSFLFKWERISILGSKIVKVSYVLRGIV
jgi:hypothetical protein